MIYKIFIKVFGLKRSFDIHQGVSPVFIRLGDLNEVWFFTPLFAFGLKRTQLAFISYKKIKTILPKDLWPIWYRLNPMFINVHRAVISDMKGFNEKDHHIKNMHNSIPAWVLNHIKIYRSEGDYLFSLENENFGGYGHYILDILPAIVTVNRNLKAKFVPNEMNIYNNILLDSCNLFKISCLSLSGSAEELKPLNKVEIEKAGLKVEEFSFIPDYKKTILTVECLPEKGDSESTFRKLYMVRSPMASSGRVLKNESVLIEWLKNNNFKIVYPESMSIYEH